MIPIVYTKWGLANRFDDCIELNEGLKKYPSLHSKILKHELSHTNKRFSSKDLRYDLTSTDGIKQVDLILFMLKHPRTLSQLLPFYWSRRRKQLIYDLNLMLTYTIFFGIIGTLSFIGWKFI